MPLISISESVSSNANSNLSTNIGNVEKVEFFAYHFRCAMISVIANKFCASDLK